MVRAPVVTQDPEAPEEDWEQWPGKSGARVVPDRDQPKVNDYVDSKVPPETITRFCDHLLPTAKDPPDKAATPLLRVRPSTGNLRQEKIVEMKCHAAPIL